MRAGRFRLGNPYRRMAINPKYDDVDIILVDPRVDIRTTLKTALTHAGIENIEHTGGIGRVTDAIEQSLGPDILICDMGSNEGEACNVVSAIRHNDIGRNPFLCVIGITWSPTAGEVAQVMNSGVDHLISAPLSPSQILTRIRALVNNRAPFVVTSDYAGPDRRQRQRRDTSYPTFQAPNSLKNKVESKWDPDGFERETGLAIGTLSSRKIDRQAEKIMSLSDLISHHSAGRAPATMIDAHMRRLDTLVREMDRRATRQGYYHISELCRACVGIVDEISGSDVRESAKDLELLKELGRAISAALFPEENATEIAHDIARTVSGAR